MTPKEKAKELVNRYRNYVSGWTTVNKPSEKPKAIYEGELMKSGRAKHCALIAVEEIISDYYTLNGHTRIASYIKVEKIEYWQEVKIEIENYGR